MPPSPAVGVTADCFPPLTGGGSGFMINDGERPAWLTPPAGGINLVPVIDSDGKPALITFAALCAAVTAAARTQAVNPPAMKKSPAPKPPAKARKGGRKTGK